MKSERTRKLRRLARLAQTLSDIETAKAVEMAHVRNQLSDEIESTHAALDRYVEDGSFLHELIIAHATRLRRRLHENAARLDSQLAVSTEMLALRGGVDRRLSEVVKETERDAESEIRQEAIDRYISGRETSLKQAQSNTLLEAPVLARNRS